MNEAATKAMAAEEQRRLLQMECDRLVPQDVRNQRGQFPTPPPLALAMLRLARRHFSGTKPVRFLDPAVGSGAFYHALRTVFEPERIASAAGFEIDAELADMAFSLWGISV